MTARSTNLMALVEGARGISLCRQAPRPRRPHPYSHDCLFASCCRRRRLSSTLARMQKPHWHHYSNHSIHGRRQFSSMMPFPSITTVGSRNGVSLMGKPNILSYYTSRALGTTTGARSLYPYHNNNVPMNGWQYSYRSFHGRMFATDANNNSSTTKPAPSSLDMDDTENDSSSNELETTDLQKQRMDKLHAIQSEVNEMESPSSSSPLVHDQQQQKQQGQEQFARAKKTPDDFADYLKEDEVTLDDDTGLMGFGIKRQNFGENELNRRGSKSSSFTSATAQNGNIFQSKSASNISSNDNETISNNIDDGEEQDTTTSENAPIIDPSTSSSETSPSAYHYKFSPTDATLSDPQRHLDRRRAIEQRLRTAQAESRAATTKNVQRALGGNFIIASAKLAAAMSSGSSSMMSEFIHSVVDCGNQALLLVGLHTSQSAPDRSHPYGYGKAIYFWALVSAVGTFFLGAGVGLTHSVGELMNPQMTEVTKEVWGVLLMSFTVDGYVFWKTVQGVQASMRVDGESGQKTKAMSFWMYATTKVRDPATLAVLLEDGAACLGVVLAIGGIGLMQYTGMPVFDGMAGVCISGLLAAMGVALANVNHKFLIGQGIDRTTREDIEKIILSRRSIDNVYSVQSQWTGPDTFSYKAEVDFDGTFLAAKLLPRYQQEFFDAKHTLDRDLRVLLSWYAEDVMRAVEREVRHIEEEIRMQYPAAQYIELEPMSKDADRYAIDDGMEAQLRRVEIDVLNRYLKSLYKIKGPGSGGGDGTNSPSFSQSEKDEK